MAMSMKKAVIKYDFDVNKIEFMIRNGAVNCLLPRNMSLPTYILHYCRQLAVEINYPMDKLVQRIK